MISIAVGPVDLCAAGSSMIRTRHIAAFGAVVAVLTQWATAPSARPRPDGQDTIVTGNPAPTADQVQSLILRAVENQHRNDIASEQFERVERVVTQAWREFGSGVRPHRAHRAFRDWHREAANGGEWLSRLVGAL